MCNMSIFIHLYSYFQFNKIQIDAEFPSAKLLFSNKNDMNLDTISLCLKDYAEAFKETLKIISIVKTLPISTASNQRFFSSFKRVKTYLRTTMGDEKLNNLMVITTEKEEASSIDLQESVNVFIYTIKHIDIH